ncbi:hypothetical protein R3Q08_31830 [Rhodococcus erythropolis]|uniref:hypothetical protein n=1 Tax=Rhodococcus erythropolis TaxID=1833 RepID=UPI00294931F0|nr:hypothetical protein [Rhodococcus erythropolis]MDV6212839.1 hypothetical protein [Rhodococcus erythropolis]
MPVAAQAELLGAGPARDDPHVSAPGARFGVGLPSAMRAGLPAIGETSAQDLRTATDRAARPDDSHRASGGQPFE